MPDCGRPAGSRRLGYARLLCMTAMAAAAARPGRVRRRDRHGRGLRGSLVPPDVPLHRTRSERFDDLVLLAVSQLEPRWEAELSAVEFARRGDPAGHPGSRRSRPGAAGPAGAGIGRTGSAHADRPTAPPRTGRWRRRLPTCRQHRAAGRPARIVLYRRPLMARAEGEEELAELVLDVIVEQFAQLARRRSADRRSWLPGRRLTQATRGRPDRARMAASDSLTPAAAEPRSASSAPAAPTAPSRRR